MKRKTLGPIICLMCLVCFNPAAHAALSIHSAAVGLGPWTGAGINYVTFDQTLGNNTVLPLGGGGGVAWNTTNTDYVNVAFNQDAAVVNGPSSGFYAPPVLSNNNGFYFNQLTGVDTTNYLTTGSTGAYPNAKITLDFTGGQRYLGLLWGSVDRYNTLSFYNGTSLIGSIIGTDVWASANGNQQIPGTYYVNITSSVPFDSVVATSSEYAFEFDNVAYSAVPEPASLIVWSVLGLSVAGAGWWRRRKAAA